MEKRKFLIAAVVLAALLAGSSSGFAAGVWTTYNKANTDNGLPSNSVRAIEFIGDVVWVATNGGGMTKYDGTNWTVYKTTEGLVHNYVWDIDIDSAGNLWIATNGGVSKFDGTNFTNYTTTTSDLNDNNCRSIEVDTDGSTIWIATIGGGINKFDGTDWTEYKTTNSDLPHNSAWGLDIDSSGNKWFATLGGAAKFDGTNWDVYTNEQLVHDDVYNVRIDDNGDVWFATIRGVNKFDGTNWTTYEEENGMAEENARDLRYDPNSGLLWVGTVSVGGAHLYDGTTWTQYKTQTSGIINNYVWVVTIESSAKVWFGTNGGISVYDITPDADFSAWPVDGIAPVTVDFTDNSVGQVASWSWDFGDGGTSTEQNPSHTYTDANTYNVSLTITGPTGSDIKTEPNLISILPAGTPVCDFYGSPVRGESPLTVEFTDESTGDVNSWTWYFGDGNSSTARNPVHIYTEAGSYDVNLAVSGSVGADSKIKYNYIGVIEPNSIEAWTTYNKANTDSGIPSNTIRAIGFDANDVWVGTNGSGMTMFDGTDWTVYKTTEGLVNNYVWEFAFDDAGNMWIGTNGGLSKYDGTNFTNYTTSNSDLTDNNIRTITVGSDGVTLWIGSVGGGVDKFDGTNWTNYKTTNSDLPNNNVWGSDIDSSGDLWFATMGGAAKFDGSDWDVYTNEQLVHDDVYDVAVDGDGDVWFGTIRGLNRFDGTNWTTWEEENGMPDENCRAVAVDENGVVWAGTIPSGQSGGVNKLDVDANEWTQYTTTNSDLANNNVWVSEPRSALEFWFGTNAGVSVLEIGGGGVPSAPAAPTNPSPADDATNVNINVTLSWTADPNADSHDVYFSTDSTVDGNDFVQNQAGTTYSPGVLDYNSTYYWRIDSKNDIGTTTGTVWSFTTQPPPPAPEKATNPNPANSATDVSITANLSWSADANALNHDVYFGTDSTPDSGEFQGNQTDTTYDPGVMDYNTTYYWRIDSNNDGGTTTGDVWSFTTEVLQAPSQATNPYPADSATGVATTVTLTWTAGARTDSHDVYFGTDSTPDSGEFQGNQSNPSYNPGTLNNDTTYYWRIDEENTAGTTTGTVWSFATQSEPNEGVMAFPGAQGFGADTPGGRGGTVIKVTNLNNSGTGSFREACSASGARIVVFEVSGTITLSSNITISNSYITIAGQTSPGGICLRKYGLKIQTHDVIVRHLRSRPGDESGEYKIHGVEINDGSYDVILDHCSFSWGIDECVGVGQSSHDMTLSRCIISEGLQYAGHPDGSHSCGFINNAGDNNISLHHNLFAHNDQRNPRSHGGLMDARNNVIYHCGSSCAYLGGAGFFETNWVKNYLFGASRRSVKFSSGTSGELYVQGNKDSNRTSDSQDEWDCVDGSESTYRVYSPHSAPAVTEIDVFPTNNLLSNVLNDSGATLPSRDAVDERIVEDCNELTGSFIDSPSEVGGWPTLSGGSPPTDTDDDGMPDSWETARGLNPNVDDSADDRDSDGYTNIEEYINGIPW